jgi:hypothetical protein
LRIASVLKVPAQGRKEIQLQSIFRRVEISADNFSIVYPHWWTKGNTQIEEHNMIQLASPLMRLLMALYEF